MSSKDYTYSKPPQSSKLNPNIFFFRQIKEPSKTEILKKVFKNNSTPYNTNIKK